MTKIRNNQVYLQQQQMMPMEQQSQPRSMYMMRPEDRTARDEFVFQHKKNGLFERLYNGIKNITGLGIGSKKVQAELDKVENGEKTEE